MQRNRTTISIEVPEDAGAELQGVVVSQLTNIDAWDWGREQPKLYLGPTTYDVVEFLELPKSRLPRTTQKSVFALTQNSARRTSQYCFSSFNPDAGIYQWATTFIPNGVNPITSDGPTLRTSVYGTNISGETLLTAMATCHHAICD